MVCFTKVSNRQVYFILSQEFNNTLTTFSRTISRLRQNRAVSVDRRQDVNAITLHEAFDVIVDAGVGQDVVGELQRDLRSDHLVSANPCDDFDRRLKVRRLDVVGYF